jgi:hypothetical protein
MCGGASMSCILVVTSREYKGRYVGFNMCGLQRNPNHQDAPEIPVPGTGYSLFIAEQGALLFSESDAFRVQDRLRKMGVDSELCNMPKKEQPD